MVLFAVCEIDKDCNVIFGQKLTRPHFINALRGHLAEFGVLWPDHRASVGRMLIACHELGDDDLAPSVIEMVRTHTD